LNRVKVYRKKLISEDDSQSAWFLCLINEMFSCTLAIGKTMTIKSLLYTGFITMTLITASHSSAAEKKLALCPGSPNCVSSQAADEEHFIAPFKIIGKAEDAWTAMKQALVSQSRTVITEETEEALHAQATSLVFRFVDDIDAILDAEAGLIHVRSASRVGYSDLGVNRRRMEALRLALRNAGVIE
jgi:uncharacterized protein (DUF1499 family)